MTNAPAKYDPKLSAYNVSESSLRRGRASLAKAVTQGTPARVMCLGDSITQGVTSTPWVNFNWPKRLRDVLTASGRWGTVGEGVIFCGGQTQASYDPRWTLGSGWNRVNGGLGSTMLQAAPGSGTLSLALPSCDTVVIGYTRHSINGTWTYNVDGGTAQTVNANGATAVLETAPFSIGSTGTHTLNIIPNPTTGFQMIQYIKYYTAASRNQLEVITGGGWAGFTTDKYVSGGASANAAGFGVLEVLDLLKPDITFILMGRNDADRGNGVAPATYEANMTTLIQRVRNTNGLECILITPPPALLTTYNANGEIFKSLYKLADSQDVALVDLWNHFGTSWNAAPYSMSSDNLHPNDAGMQQLGRLAANLLISV